MKKNEQQLSQQHLLRRISILLLIVVLGCVDFWTGYEFSFSVFYLLPVSIAAWYDNRIVTAFTIVISALTWLSADFISGHHYSNSIIPFWNACVRLAFFTIVAVLMYKVRNSLAKMTEMAMKDALTGLNNSRAFQHHYQQLQTLGQRQKIKFAIAMIDLDGFKGVNDRLGHSVGDEVLRQFAQLLNQSTRSTDVVARMGGDEFSVILLNTSRESVAQYDHRLRDIFSKSGLKEQYQIDFSMGIHLFDQLPSQSDAATHYADQLMYQSKQKGKSQTTICQI